MNQLTWVIYLSDVIPSVGIFFMCLGTVLTVLVLLFTVASLDLDDRLPKKRVLIFLPIGLILLLASLVIPSRQTLLLMAGSQFSEQIVKTPEAQDLMKSIQGVIQDQLESLKKK